MSIDSDVQCDQDGKPLPHFTPYPTPASLGEDVFSQDLHNCDGLETNVYCFPPFTFMKALLSFLQSQKAIATAMVLGLSPRLSWWLTIVAMSSRGVILPGKDALGVLLTPSKHGFRPTSLPFDLWFFSS